MSSRPNPPRFRTRTWQMTLGCPIDSLQAAARCAAVVLVAFPGIAAAITATPTPGSTATPGPAAIRIDTTLGGPGELVAVSVFLARNDLRVARTENVIRFGTQAKIVDCSPAQDSKSAPATFSFLPPGCSPGQTCDAVHASVEPSATMEPFLGSPLYTCDALIDDDVPSGSLLPLECDSAASADPAGSALDTLCEDGAILIPGAVNPPIGMPAATCAAEPFLLYDARFDPPDNQPGEPPRLDVGDFPRRGPSTFLLGRPSVEAELGELGDQPLVFDRYTEIAFEVAAGLPLYQVALDLFLSPRNGPPAEMFTIFVDSPEYHRIDFTRPGQIDVFDASPGRQTIGFHKFSTLMHVRIDISYSDRRWRFFLDNVPFYEGDLLGHDLEWVRLAGDPSLSILGEVGVDNLTITGCRDVATPPPTSTPTATATPSRTASPTRTPSFFTRSGSGGSCALSSPDTAPLRFWHPAFVGLVLTGTICAARYRRTWYQREPGTAVARSLSHKKRIVTAFGRRLKNWRDGS